MSYNIQLVLVSCL